VGGTKRRRRRDLTDAGRSSTAVAVVRLEAEGGKQMFQPFYLAQIFYSSPEKVKKEDVKSTERALTCRSAAPSPSVWDESQ